MLCWWNQQYFDNVGHIIGCKFYLWKMIMDGRNAIKSVKTCIGIMIRPSGFNIILYHITLLILTNPWDILRYAFLGQHCMRYGLGALGQKVISVSIWNINVYGILGYKLSCLSKNYFVCKNNLSNKFDSDQWQHMALLGHHGMIRI